MRKWLPCPTGCLTVQDAVLQLLVAAAPAAILYFTGWSYLYFYLGKFDINISEINFDLPTIFIYSYPPLHTLWECHFTVIIASTVVLALLWLFAPSVRGVIGAIRPGLWFQARIRPLVQRIRALQTTARILIVLGFLVFVLPFPLKTLTAWAASHAADNVWEGHAPKLKPILEKNSSDQVGSALAKFLAGQLPESAASRKSVTDSASLLENFAECEKRGPFQLIFAVEAHYYLLCRGAQVESKGAVYEVMGKEGLISVRYVDRLAGKEAAE